MTETTSQKEKPLLITREETMNLLQCGPRTLSRWAAKFKFAKLGRNYVRADVEKKIAALVEEAA